MQTPQSIMAISGALDALIHLRRDLTDEETAQAMAAILNGEATDVEMTAFLVALHLKGETANELTGAARALRTAAGTPPFNPSDSPLLDTCGTGGDHSGTFNISTLAALVASGAGLRVAKHGNRSLSSVCGSADLLEALGVDLAHAATTLPSAGIAFYFAPLFHGSTRYAQPVRRQLKMRTLFNYLGPLTNPAGANVQVAGAFSSSAASRIAQALANLGLPRGVVVAGADGLDEVTTTSTSDAFAIRDGTVLPFTLAPEDFGVPRATPEHLRGGSIEQNRQIALAILDGEQGPRRDIVLANVALALQTAGVTATLPDAMRQAELSIDSGRARAKLDALRGK